MENYKVFSEDEEKIYDREIYILMEKIKEGMHIDEACKEINAEDPEMRQIIEDDILKILIANLHYQQGMSLEDVAKQLDIAFQRVKDTQKIMLEDVIHTLNEEGVNGSSSGMTH
jgi:hypothetical protein